MKNLILILIIFIIAGAVLAQSYNVYKPQNFNANQLSNAGERILFILDFSESMTEDLGGTTKINMMKDTMSQILPTINKNAWVGLRVYGNRLGFTAYDACRASSLMVPITPSSEAQIQQTLTKVRPRGMTPITFSLKRAVNSDFLGYDGTKHIILLTDGGENCDESPCVWSMNLIKTRKDVNIDVIAFNISNQDDLDQLECTALVTKGKFYTAKTAAELAHSLQNSINTKKQVEAVIIPNN